MYRQIIHLILYTCTVFKKAAVQRVSWLMMIPVICLNTHTLHACRMLHECHPLSFYEHRINHCRREIASVCSTAESLAFESLKLADSTPRIAINYGEWHSIKPSRNNRTKVNFNCKIITSKVKISKFYSKQSLIKNFLAKHNYLLI